MFLVDMNFTDIEKVTAELTQQHRDHLAKEYENNKLMFGGRKEPRTGGIIISLHSEEQELRKMLDSDPFVCQGLVNYSITKFTPVMASEQYAELLEL